MYSENKLVTVGKKMVPTHDAVCLVIKQYHCNNIASNYCKYLKKYNRYLVNFIYILCTSINILLEDDPHAHTSRPRLKKLAITKATTWNEIYINNINMLSHVAKSKRNCYPKRNESHYRKVQQNTLWT